MDETSFKEEFRRETEKAILRKLKNQKPHERAIMAGMCIATLKVFGQHFQANGKERVTQ
ncbi:hypothetical protein [Mesorhizobium sp. B2-8-3]|uniref:hypothetical protein n=1 Tax=Mesorhizobium sp. B2-8-3 TaxID=2589905 RepID=UPI0015E45B06|nr:hypothetical protein [Mesorhizobium sp. B2-8-3]